VVSIATFGVLPGPLALQLSSGTDGMVLVMQSSSVLEDNAHYGQPFLAILQQNVVGWDRFRRHIVDRTMTYVRSLSGVLLICAVALTRAEAAQKAAKPAEPLAQDTSLNNVKDAPKAPSLACGGPFAKDTTHDKLAMEFGVKNVAFKDIELASNVLTKATILFDTDPTRRLVVFWKDDKTRANPSEISIEAPSTWTGPGGVRNGLTLRDIEKLNGGHFSVTGFGGIGGGEASKLGGSLVNLPGDCTLKIRFEPGIASPLPPRFASVTGDVQIASTNLILRRVRPQVAQWSINYR